jgi:hypothetical protein
MERKNDLFLVMAYTPNRFKENLLRNLINELKKLDQDILLVSHTIQSQDIIDSVDYYLYDKENLLIKQYETECYDVFSHGNINLNTQLSCTNLINHGLAMLKMLYSGLSLAKMLNYEKVIQIEYDTKIKNHSYLFKLNNDLNRYDCITFGNDEFCDCQIGAFNLKGYSFDELIYNEYLLREEFMIRLNWGMAEKIIEKKLIKNKNHLIYSREERDENLIIDVSNKTENNIKFRLSPIYNEEDNSVYIYFSNKFGDSIKYDVILNDNIVMNFSSGAINEFNIVKICDFDDLKTLKFIINDTEIYYYDFNDEYLKNEILKNKCIIDFNNNKQKQKQNMNITYIIPTVGRSSISNTIQSILNEDKTARIIIQRGGTAGKNRNLVMMMEIISNELNIIQSDFISFIDDDDFYNEGYLKQIDNEYDLIVMRMNQNGSIIPKEDNILYESNIGINFAIKTDFLKKICMNDGKFDTEYLFDNQPAEDWRFLEKILKHNPKIKITDDVYYTCSQVNHILPSHLQYKPE